ncbi:hypothetical protein NL676_003754 [Syzygium grande]|nr:hypothetical protein NL676_003754 [Syzygium grande]
MDHTIDIPQEVRSPKCVPQTSRVAVRKSPCLNPGQDATPSNPSSGVPTIVSAGAQTAGKGRRRTQRSRVPTTGAQRGRLPVLATDPAHEAHLPACKRPMRLTF